MKLSWTRAYGLIVLSLNYSRLRDDFIELILGLLDPALNVEFLWLLYLSWGLKFRLSIEVHWFNCE